MILTGKRWFAEPRLSSNQARVKLIYQHDSKDCGPTCLQMVHMYFGGRIPISQMRTLCDLTIDGVSMLGMVHAAESLGLDAHPMLVQLESIGSLPTPFIAHWLDDHFVVVTDVSATQVRVVDPELGHVTYLRQDFVDRWTGTKEYGELKTDHSRTRGAVLLVQPSDSFVPQTDTADIFDNKFLGPDELLSGNGRQVFWIMVAFPAIMATVIALPIMMKAMIDEGIGAGDVALLQILLLGYLVLSLSKNIIGGIRDLLLARLGANISIKIANRFMQLLLNLRMNFFDRRSLGDLLQRQQDHHRVEVFLTAHSLPALFSLLTLLIFAVMLGFFNLTVLAVFSFFAGFSVWWLVIFAKRRRPLDQQRFEVEGIVQDNAVEIISSVRDLKAFNKTDQKIAFFDQLLRRRYETVYRSARLDEMQNIGASVLLEFGEIAALAVIGLAVASDKASLGSFFAVLFIVGQMRGPLGQAVPFFQAAQDANLSYGRLTSLTHEDEEPHAMAGDASFQQTENLSISLHSVSFRYNPIHQRNILTDLSCQIPAGKRTAIVGESGAGKSTLIKLLTKFYEPSDGQIMYGDQDLGGISGHAWRERVCNVFQDGVIFNSTLSYNIALSHSIDDPEKLAKVLEAANVNAFLEQFPNGLVTSVGRGGWQLSEGQKQRVLIARALYRNPEIFIFDEATSALDVQNEQAIIANLERVFADRTSIVISHRWETIRNADQVILLHKGRVAASGSMDSVMHNSEEFRRIFQI